MYFLDNLRRVLVCVR